MAHKDPAALFYIGDWLKATKEMPADCRGWYLNLILHQFDKGDLPNDIEELANLADVRFSEFERFKQVFKQVLEQKFKQNGRGRLENAVAKEIIQRRETFKDERSRAGRIGYFVKYIKRRFKDLGQDLYFLEFVKNNLDIEKTDTKDEQVLKQVLEHLLKLYRNENENKNRTLPFTGKVSEERQVSEDPESDKDRLTQARTKSPKQYPVPSDFNGLPEIELGKVTQYLGITKKVNLTTDDILGLWDMFKTRNLTGENFYKDERAVYKHFLESLKFEKFDTHATHKQNHSGKSIGNKKSEGFQLLADSLRADA